MQWNKLNRENIKAALNPSKFPMYKDDAYSWMQGVAHNRLSTFIAILGLVGVTCITVGVFVVGSIFSDITAKIYDQKQGWFNGSVWLAHYHIFLWFALAAIGWGIKQIANKVAKNQLISATQVRATMEWFYEDMGFRENHTAAIRCTLWLPLKRKRDGQPIMLVQLIDYVPRRIFGKDSSAASKAHPSGKAGRLFKVARIDDNNEEHLIGMMGQCVAESINRKKALCAVASVPSNTPLVEFLVKQYNFERRHAERMPEDRKAYLCLVMMDRDCNEVIGVVYCDAGKEDALTEQHATQAQRLLPRIAQALEW